MLEAIREDSATGAVCYFSFTKSNTKIAKTPTVMGKSTKKGVSQRTSSGQEIRRRHHGEPVNIPRMSLLFQFMCARPRFRLILQDDGFCAERDGTGHSKSIAIQVTILNEL